MDSLFSDQPTMEEIRSISNESQVPRPPTNCLRIVFLVVGLLLSLTFVVLPGIKY